MAVHIHKGSGGDTLVQMKRGDQVREIRADMIRHLSGKCSTLLSTMPNAGMARQSNTSALRERTVQCWNEGCWDQYGELPHEGSFAPGVKVDPAIRTAHRTNRKALTAAKRAAAAAAKAAAKKSAAKKSAPKSDAKRTAKSAPKRTAKSAAEGGDSAVA